VTLSSKQWVAFRAVTRAMERLTEGTHIFGTLDAWHPLRAARRQPAIMTVIGEGPALDPAMYARIDYFVAESDRIYDQILAAGIPAAKVRIIYPGVDLDYFSVTPPPSAERFRVLFASTPARPAEFAERGIPLLVELAKRQPEIEVVILWRAWGDPRAAAAALEALDLPPNVVVRYGDEPDMRRAYQQAHAVAALFAPGKAKSCPNSVVEALACGRPVIVSASSGVARLVERHGCGVTAELNATAVSAAVTEHFAAQARPVAEQFFSRDTCIRQYADVWRAVGESRASARH
jgi:glycosyltransferase involved in cell wall biosynthesis